jgi:hypothetical protein
MTSTQYIRIWHAPSWPQRWSWRWRIAEARSLPEAEKVLDGYFALLEEGVSWTEDNPLDRCS